VTNERRGLGRGLSALIPPAEPSRDGLTDVPVDRIDPNPRQPREVFDEDELAELAASIREVGLLQPLVVRRAGERYELVAGERRLRAAGLAGLDHVPVVVRETSDTDLLREALIENIHRTELNPLEEAAAYRQLLDDFGATHEELARRIGKSRPAVSNALRLLTLPPPVQRRVAAGVLSAGHAKALLALDSAAEQERLAERIVSEGLSVRRTEEIARLAGERTGGSDDGDDTVGGGDGAATRVRAHERGGSVHAPGLADLEERLSDALLAKVRVRMGARTGRLTIEFTSVDDLERVVGVLAAGLQTPIPVREQPLR
jgi:ParB family transcriptional regulator, chromosome partitioning protein